MSDVGDKLNAHEGMAASMGAGVTITEHTSLRGHFEAECRDSEGNLLWRDGFDNVVTYAGQNQLLAQLTGNTTQTTPYMLLIGNNTTGPVVGDTLGSHGGWTEAGTANSPTFAARVALTLNAPSNGNISTSAGSVFTFTGSGNVSGAGVGFNGATSVTGNATGTLLSAGNFTAVQPVIATNVLTVTYSLAL